MKIVTVVGARPQFIKAAVVSRAFIEHRSDIKEIIIHTGQHYDSNMSEVFFQELEIPKPKYNLAIGGGSHGQNTGRMLEGIENILMQEKPDFVNVYGDTDSTLAGSLAAAKLHIPVSHVEAGLRSFNHKMPEELNRILTDHISTLLFTPSTTASQNLNREGISYTKIRQVGDVMYDAALYYSSKAKAPLEFTIKGDFILSTIHRAENTDDAGRLGNIIGALNEIAKETPVIMPLHPRTRKLLYQGTYDTNNITLIEPVGYLEMVWLLKHCKLVVTDSGGLQKEAYFFGKRCIVTRDESEWVELINAGMNKLSSHIRNELLQNIRSYLYQHSDITTITLYGNGSAGKLIASDINI